MLCFVGNYRCVTVVKNFYTKKDYSIFFEKKQNKKTKQTKPTAFKGTICDSNVNKR